MNYIEMNYIEMNYIEMNYIKYLLTWYKQFGFCLSVKYTKKYVNPYLFQYAEKFFKKRTVYYRLVGPIKFYKLMIEQRKWIEAARAKRVKKSVNYSIQY